MIIITFSSISPCIFCFCDPMYKFSISQIDQRFEEKVEPKIYGTPSADDDHTRKLTKKDYMIKIVVLLYEYLHLIQCNISIYP